MILAINTDYFPKQRLFNIYIYTQTHTHTNQLGEGGLQIIPCEVCVVQIGSGTSFPPVFPFFPITYQSTNVPNSYLS